MFAAESLSRDRFLDGRLTILQPKDGYRAAMDPVLLAAAVPARPGEAVLELGCGAGLASLCLARRVPGVRISGLEKQAAYADLAHRNGALNDLMFDVIEGDIAAPPAILRHRSFDHVIANPPYFPSGSGTAARDTGRELAQREDLLLADWVRLGLKRLRPGGRLTFIQAADRLPDLLRALGAGTGSTAVLPIAARLGRPAGRIILQTRKGGRGAFRLLPPFIVHEGASHLKDGDDLTAAAGAVLRNAHEVIL
jgi:tRNA1(Val) A37 N6-methylase TrmN6